MEPEIRGTIRRALLKWYGRRRRDLPWRRTSAPYRVWVSEIMLQQTQVETVKPYFRRFLRRFPSVRALAQAPADAVMKAWEGLGYYARARNLHRAAKIISSDCGGRLPESPEELMKLPGIGRSTAGAISSIAFGRDAPMLDGNVARVLCRVFRIRRNPRQSRTQRNLWDMAQELLPPGHAGDFNQALMDLGATVCVPRNPRCTVCPVAIWCLARAHGEQRSLPVRSRRRATTHYVVAAGVVRRGKLILIDRRKPEGLLGGLWEFPGGKRKENESLERCLTREIREELGIRVKIVRPLISVPHAYTHFRITLHVYECRYLSGVPRALGCAEWRWVRPDELDHYAFPSANRKVIAELRMASRNGSTARSVAGQKER
ncbi:MAG: A/G-specific adenine glycosylase [Candidatus Brocadiia bacterium]